MNKKEFHQQDPEKRRQLRDDRLHIEAERGWAGQHGQHPENAEEKDQATTHPRHHQTRPNE